MVELALLVETNTKFTNGSVMVPCFPGAWQPQRNVLLNGERTLKDAFEFCKALEELGMH